MKKKEKNITLMWLPVKLKRERKNTNIVSELYEKYRRNFLLMIPFIIDMMNNVYNLPMNLPTDSVGNSIGKNSMS
jgi:hypothetical protein